MAWTILILVVAVALYVFADKSAKVLGKKSASAAPYVKNAVALVAVILAVIGVNRLGVGTSHYLTESNPAILQEMATNMQSQERDRSSRMVKDYVRKSANEMMRWAPVLGNPEASKTIFVWTDTFCPYCRRVHNEIKRVLAERDDVRVVIKTFPVRGEISDIPGRWTIAAKIQDPAKSAALYGKIMANDYWGKDHNAKDLNKVMTENLRKYAREVGLDVQKLEQDLTGSAVAQELSQTRELAQAFQISGTPYLIIGDQVFPGAIPYQQIMNALR